MNIKYMVLTLCIGLGGCQSYSGNTNHQSKSSLRSLPGGNIAYFAAPEQGVNNHKALEKELDAKNKERNEIAERERQEASIRVQNKQNELRRKEEANKQSPKTNITLSCSQRAVITYNLMREQAYISGDYRQVIKYDIPTLKKICEKTK